MSEISETSKALIDKEAATETLHRRLHEMEAALLEHTAKADSIESTVFHHFSEILNSKKRKIRHLNHLLELSKDPS
jgi:hypothetical protein